MFKRKSIIFSLTIFSFIFACHPDKKNDQAQDSRDRQDILEITKETAADAGIKTETVRYDMIAVPLETYGEVQFDPRKLLVVSSRVAGRLEKVTAFTGDKVTSGQILTSVYSAEFIAVQNEYLQIFNRVRNADETANTTDAELGKRLLNSASTKLTLMGIADDQLQELKNRQLVSELLCVHAPFNGIVIESNLVTGAWIEENTALFKLADIRSVWVEAHIPEKDISFIRPGLAATITVAAFARDIFHGKVTASGNVIDETSRTMRVRLEVDNRTEKLKPGMYANIRFLHSQNEKILTIPEQAVRRIDGQDIVFVLEKENKFKKTFVKTGRTINDRLEILQGLKPQDVIATEGSFALKAELLKSTFEGE
jgi:RND family efflux transporter MFP subunit